MTGQQAVRRLDGTESARLASSAQAAASAAEVRALLSAGQS
jgi:hypothetical protein